MILTYTQLLNETINLYLTGDYEKAYNYITKYGNKVKGNLAQIYNFRYAIASKAGMKDLALALMKEAIIDQGFWYAKEYLESDEDLNLLRDDSEFKNLVSICNTREKEAHGVSEGEMALLISEGVARSDNPQLIIALHGNQESNEISKLYWKDILDNNRMIALLQSSEIEFSNAYSWNDLDRGENTIDNFKKRIITNLGVKEERIILSGFSAGARQVLHHSFVTNINIKGLILLAPWLPELEAWEEKLGILRDQSIHVCIVCGNQDDDSFEDSKRLAKLLKKHQVMHHFHIIENLDHDYPSNFSIIIEDALKFINS
ncbi:MAG TPA: alpha/beta hydrolase [Clostridia bacterium]|nr:alpha/beta hydrolase [Clostridia bacterium]